MEEDNLNRVEYSTAAPGSGNEEIENRDRKLSGEDFENELISDISEDKIMGSISKNDSAPTNENTTGQGLIDVPQGESDESDEDELDMVNSSSAEELATGAYSQSSQEVLTTFDFSKKTTKLDENDNPLSIPSTPPELSHSEVISVNIINHMKRDPLYAASILTINGDKATIDTILTLRQDSASLVCKEEGINELFDELLPGNSLADGAIKKFYSNRPILHEPEPGWLTHDFIDVLTTELKRLRIDRAEQKWSDENASKMQMLNKAVQSVDEVRAAEISNSGSEPSLNYGGKDGGLKGRITSVPASSLIPENEDDRTDIIPSEENSKFLNFCYKTEENEIVTFPGGASPKLPKNSVVHCLAGVQELPEFLGPTVNLNSPDSYFGYSMPENKRMLNMGQQTDSEPSSPRGGVHMLGNNYNVLNEENAYPDSVIEQPPRFGVALPPNRLITQNTVNSADSDELNDFFFKTHEDSDDDDECINNLSTIAGIVAEKTASEEEATTNNVDEDQKVEGHSLENLVPNPAIVETGDSSKFTADPSVPITEDGEKSETESETAAATDITIETEVYSDDFFIDEDTVDKVEDEINEYISILALTEEKINSDRTALESLAPEKNVDEPVEIETILISEDAELELEIFTSTTLKAKDSEGNVNEDNSKCGANFTRVNPTGTSKIFHHYVDGEGSISGNEDTEDNPKEDLGPPVAPKTDKAAEIKNKYLGGSILEIVAAERGLDDAEEPATPKVPPPKIGVVSLTDKSVLRNERQAKAKKYSADISHKLGTSSSAAAGAKTPGNVNEPGTPPSPATRTPSFVNFNKPGTSKSGKVSAKVSPIQARKPSISAGKTVKETSKAKIMPALNDASTSASKLDSLGPSGVQAEKSGAALPTASGSSGAAPEKSRIRKGSTFPTVKPKTRSKPIRPITQLPAGYAQKRRDGSRPTTSTSTSRPTTAGVKEKEGPRPSTSKKSGGKPIWR